MTDGLCEIRIVIYFVCFFSEKQNQKWKGRSKTTDYIGPLECLWRVVVAPERRLWYIDHNQHPRSYGQDPAGHIAVLRPHAGGLLVDQRFGSLSRRIHQGWTS